MTRCHSGKPSVEAYPRAWTGLPSGSVGGILAEDRNILAPHRLVRTTIGMVRHQLYLNIAADEALGRDPRSERVTDPSTRQKTDRLSLPPEA